MLNAATVPLSSQTAQTTRTGSLLGRPIVNPVVDYLFLGGAITIPTFRDIVDNTTDARDIMSSGDSLSPNMRLTYRSSDFVSLPESAR